MLGKLIRYVALQHIFPKHLLSLFDRIQISPDILEGTSNEHQKQ